MGLRGLFFRRSIFCKNGPSIFEISISFLITSREIPTTYYFTVSDEIPAETRGNFTDVRLSLRIAKPLTFFGKKSPILLGGR
ncbi:hypothetical protein SY88_05675 [Clostridiales bacterium PH28_bin88]|nr:hypothetical protein SY88_05675 [Clostridiales bacterium PH28_bin88]